jgi:hypothetical protein
MRRTYLVRLLQRGEASRRAFGVVVVFVGMMDERETPERTLLRLVSRRMVG